jgi:hypothetical protein
MWSLGGTITATVASAARRHPQSLSITRPTVATALRRRAGPTESDTCTLKRGATLNVRTNAALVGAGSIVAWDWSYTVGTSLTATRS